MEAVVWSPRVTLRLRSVTYVLVRPSTDQTNGLTARAQKLHMNGGLGLRCASALSSDGAPEAGQGGGHSDAPTPGAAGRLFSLLEDHLPAPSRLHG